MVFSGRAFLCFVVGAFWSGQTGLAQSSTNTPSKEIITSEKPVQNPSRIKATILIDQARVDLHAGRIEEAENMLKEAISLDPLRRDAKYYLTLVGERRFVRNKAVVEPIFPVIKNLDDTLHFGIPVNVRNRPLREIADDLNAK